MKRALGFTVDGIKVRISVFMLAAIVFCFSCGAAIAALFGKQELFTSRVFSPISFGCSEEGLLRIAAGNFITYSCFVILGMIFSVSAFGFLVIPALTFLVGFSLSGSAVFMMESGMYLRCFLLCLPLWAVYVSVLIVYYSLCFFSSFSLFRSCGLEAEGESGFSLSQSLKMFYFVACFSTVFSVVTSLLEFFLYRAIS